MGRKKTYEVNLSPAERDPLKNAVSTGVENARQHKQWVIPPRANAEFVCAMEEVLDLYHEPYDPSRPVVCFDEGTKQLIRETMVEYAHGMKYLTDIRYPEVETIRGVQDNLSTHKPAALYQAFSPQEARRILKRL